MHLVTEHQPLSSSHPKSGNTYKLQSALSLLLTLANGKKAASQIGCEPRQRSMHSSSALDKLAIAPELGAAQRCVAVATCRQPTLLPSSTRLSITHVHAFCVALSDRQHC